MDIGAEMLILGVMLKILLAVLLTKEKFRINYCKRQSFN